MRRLHLGGAGSCVGLLISTMLAVQIPSYHSSVDRECARIAILYTLLLALATCCTAFGIPDIYTLDNCDFADQSHEIMGLFRGISPDTRCEIRGDRGDIQGNDPDPLLSMFSVRLPCCLMCIQACKWGIPAPTGYMSYTC